MKIKLIYLITMLTLTVNMTLMAQDWKTPIIKGYGQMVENEAVAMQPNPEKEYKVVFHIKDDGEREGINTGLFKVARLINLLGNAGVPQDHIKVVAVVSGKAGFLALSDAAYQERLGKANPNLDVLQKLTDYGVTFVVCSQTLAQNKIDEKTQLNRFVKVTLSALTAVIGYQSEGYLPVF